MATTTESAVLHSSLSARPLKIVSSKGNYLTTEDGRQIFDATGGAAVACLGHNHPRVKEAIVRQLDQVSYVYSPFFTSESSEQLAQLLVDSTGGEMSRVFIVSSGTEAVEAMVKLVRQYFTELPEPQPQRTKFIARKQSYHGNTLGSLSIGFHQTRRAIYEPILAQNVSHVSPCYPYRGMKEGETEEQYVSRLADELDAEFQRLGPDTVCAFIAETTSGMTIGAVPPVPGYWQAMKAVCDKYGALLCMDEVMSGMGRIGSLHAWEQEGVVPHLQTVAKGLGAGYEPIGAMLVHKSIVDTLSAGTKSFVHSQTYQGHPVACAAALEVQKIIRDEHLVQNVKELGECLGTSLKKRFSHHKHVGDIRGRGFFWGLEFVEDKTTKRSFPPAKKVAMTIHEVGKRNFGISLLPGTGVADGIQGDVIVLAPAYNIFKEDIDIILERLEKTIEEVLG